MLDEEEEQVMYAKCFYYRKEYSVASVLSSSNPALWLIYTLNLPHGPEHPGVGPRLPLGPRRRKTKSRSISGITGSGIRCAADSVSITRFIEMNCKPVIAYCVSEFGSNMSGKHVYHLEE